jgi:gliding motility-associated-like protein
MLAAGMLAALLLIPGRLTAQDIPDIPDLIRVTVDHADNGVLIQWEPSEDTDIEFYHMYKQVGESFVQLFTFNATTFEYKHMTSGLVDLAYAVVAEDSLGNRSIFSDNVQKAVDVDAEFDLCAQANIIQWTPYLGWEGQISGYRIYGGVEGTGMQELTFVPATTLSYTHTGVQPNTSYTYYVETVNTITGITSLSPIDTVTTLYPEAPSYLTIDHVSVLDESSVEIKYSADIAGPVKSFRLLRRSNTASPFLEVDVAWNVMSPTGTFVDLVPTGSISYQYLVESVFLPVSCSTPLMISQSNRGNNILLVNEADNQTVTLSWTPYASYEPGLAGYLIQRSDGNGAFVDVQTVGPLTTQWQEMIQSLVNGFQPGEIQYRVIALSNPGMGGAEEESVSNPTTVHLETHLQIPNAFTPGSNDMNFEFKPLMDFAPREYVLIVMDRGGRKLFETTNPEEGWDGTYMGGDFVNEAVYVYYIQYTDYTGMFRTYSGNVTVLYP